MIKKIVRITGIIIGSFLAFFLVYLGLAFALSRIAVNDDVIPKNEVDIYILSNGVHTDLVLPIRTEIIDWSMHLPFENTTAKDSTARFLAFGWGDKGFYLETPTWGDLTFTVAFKAAFALGNSAIHATYYKGISEGEKCKRITLSNAEYEHLVKYISSSFKLSDSGSLIHIATTAVYGKADAFYEAVGRYSMLHTCNTWANNGLKACGQKACLWTPFDTGIFYQYSN